MGLLDSTLGHLRHREGQVGWRPKRGLGAVILPNMNIKSARRGVTREKGKEGLLGTVGEWGQLGKEEVLFIEVVYWFKYQVHH